MDGRLRSGRDPGGAADALVEQRVLTLAGGRLRPPDRPRRPVHAARPRADRRAGALPAPRDRARDRGGAAAMSATSPALLSLRDVTHRFGGVTAVQDVSFDVASGEIVGLIGPNGAGKTTLINLVTGLLAPTRGRIAYAGTPIVGLRPHAVGRLGIARTFQVVRPFANMTVLENVAVGAMYGAGGHRRSTGEAMARAAEVLDFLGLATRRDDPAESLPIGGRKQLEL